MDEVHEKQKDLVEFIEAIDGILNISINAENGEEVADMISKLTSVLSTSTFAVALAERIYNEKLGKVLCSLPTGMSATDKKLVLAGRLSSEKYYSTLAERQNAALVHAVDGFRSILSFIKEETKMNSMYNQSPR